MTKYYAEIHLDGKDLAEENFGEYYDTEKEAEEAALYAISCIKQGAEIFHMSDPGDYPFDGSKYDDVEYSIVEEEV